LNELSSAQLQPLFNGNKEPLEKNGLTLVWRGFNTLFSLLSKSSDSEIRETLIPLLDQSQCLSCKGTRLNPLGRHVKIEDLSIADLCHQSITRAKKFIDSIQLSAKQAPFLEETLRQLKHRLHFLSAIGIGYLSLDRSAPSLSGGEAQRIRLARQLGSGLTGCLYVLDEPTIGLHPYDNQRLNKALKDLCAMGNTLLLVEHDPLTIQLADRIIDFGPHAGKQGGKIVSSGTLEHILADENSLTGNYLSGRIQMPVPDRRRLLERFIEMRGASLHNLKNIDVSIPRNQLTV
ncbi:MAG: excinuclease ABC subunit A, partial [Chlamydiota bacterium]